MKGYGWEYVLKVWVVGWLCDWVVVGCDGEVGDEVVEMVWVVIEVGVEGGEGEGWGMGECVEGRWGDVKGEGEMVGVE